MKRTLKTSLLLLFLALCIGLAPAAAAASRTRIIHPAPNVPPDIVEVGWYSFMAAAERLLSALEIVHIAPNPDDDDDVDVLPRLFKERPREPGFVVPGFDRDRNRSRSR